MADTTNQIHVSPGVYSSMSVDMKQAANSLGITKLALVGETLKGPAFQTVWVTSPTEYANNFGGTSPKKFKGSNYPKYELPYIANEYLKKSNQLCVIRTLGFSGYNAGPAWVLTGSKEGTDKHYVIAIIRSKGAYGYRAEYAKTTTKGCQCTTAYDSLTYDVGEITDVASCSDPKKYNGNAVMLGEYYSLNNEGNSCTDYSFTNDKDTEGFDASSGNLGRFTIKCIVGLTEGTESACSESANTISIPVSLNKADKDYILNVLGTNPSDGSYPLYVETLYDVAWENLVMGEGFNTIDKYLTFYEPASASDYDGLDGVNGILTKYSAELTKKDVGKRFLYANNLVNGSPVSGVSAYEFDYKYNTAIKQDPMTNITIASSAITSTGITIANDELFQITGSNSDGYYINQTGADIVVASDGTVSGNITVNELIEPDKAVGLNKVTTLNGIEYYKHTDHLINGKIYTVAVIKDASGTKHYVYKEYYALKDADDNEITDQEELSGDPFYKHSVLYTLDPTNTNTWDEYIRALDRLQSPDSLASRKNKLGTIVYNYEDDLYYKLDDTGVTPVICDLNDYKSSYRYSSTPWVVSNAKGDANHIDLTRLFRFHTISDGKTSVSEIKVSIENIRPDSGQFDVVVRDYNDSDASQTILERYSKCTMTKGKKYIGYLIGTLDGMYESKSKYITVEVNESSAAENSVPAGFLGYSVPQFGGATIADESNNNINVAPMMYNTSYDEDTNKKKQYFGISDIVGYDEDYFSYKGKMSVIEDPDFMSHGFHLDCRIDPNSYGDASNAPKITVDGEEGYEFDTVSINARTNTLTESPIISTEDDMTGCIYEDIKLRKFTLAFAGGFDGWDEYREQRTNTNEFASSTYKGYINKSNGIGYAFDSFSTFGDASLYNLNGGAITSDYYATLAGVSLLKNPEEVDINLLATPGIDTINNPKLTNEIFEILEDRADTLYVPITPDKEAGAGDFDSDIQDVEYTVSDFQDQDLHSDYATTYYPWVKIEDNGQYIFVSPTKDVVRNIAESDNTDTTQHKAPAGTTRGKVNAIRARKNLKVSESDALYEASINPVRTFAKEGILIFGQKTLREENDLASRVDVMRCMMRMRKLLSIATIGFVFEEDDTATLKSFKSTVNGVMQTFVDARAIKKYKPVFDESQEAMDRKELSVTIYFMPNGAVEYVKLNFVCTDKDSYFE